MTDPVLELVNVSIPFGGKGPDIADLAPLPPEAPEGLRDVCLRLDAGERFALLGASGAGKSSFLRAIAEPEPGVAGTIRVAGRDIRTTPPREWDALLLDQRPLLFPHMDVRGNVAFPLQVRGVRGERLEEEVIRALEAVRMEAFAHRAPGSLSGGQAHRVALARAIAAGPALLLLDEPFTGLDPELRTTLQETVVRVASDRGIATLTVTHDPDEAGRIADRVGILSGGRLARVAPPAELFLDPGSAGVARLLGWPNRIEARIAEGRLHLPDGSTHPIAPRPAEARAKAEGTGLGSGAGHLAYPADGPGRLVFPAEGARLVEPPAGELRVRIVRVTRSPSGAVAHWALDPGSGAEDWGDEARDHEAPDHETQHHESQHHETQHHEAKRGEGREAVTGEVAVDPLESPQPGASLGLEFRWSRVRFYPHDG